MKEKITTTEQYMVKVGIFWALPDGKIYVREENLLSVGNANTEIIDSSFSHFNEWDNIAQRYPYADFASYPRGRVVYDIAKHRYVIYADKCIQAHKIAIIVKRFCDGQDYVKAYDEHYCCDKCTPKDLF